jgi:hypothetical protein
MDPTVLLVTACDGVTGATQVFGQINLHLGGGFEGHWIEVGEEFGQQTQAIPFDHPRGFESGFVIGKTLFGSEAGHAHVNAREFGFASGVQAFDFAMARCGGVEKYDVNIVMMGGLGGGADLAKGAALKARFGLCGGGHSTMR